MSLAKGPITVLSDRPAGVRRPAPDHERQDDDDLHYTPGRGDRRGRRRCRHPRRHRIPDATTSATAATTRRPQRLRSRPKAGFEPARNLIAQRAPGRVGAMQRSRAEPVEGRRPAPDAEGAAINTEPAEGRAAKARPPRALQKNDAVGAMSRAPRPWASASWSSSWVWEARSASSRLR